MDEEKKQEAGLPEWIFVTYTGKGENEREVRHINEPLFCKLFKEENNIVRINDFFYLDGEKVSDDLILSMIQKKLMPYFPERTGRKTADVFVTLSNSCHTEQPEPNEWKIYCKGNVTLTFNREGNVSSEQENVFTLTRLPVALNMKAQCPTFKKYLSDLFYEEDIPTIQEFLGYCLIPSTRAQSGLFIRGEGGEGKSVFRDVVMRLFGKAAIQEGIHKLGDPFTMINLENKLVCVDDDMRTELLNETETIKKLITASGKFQLEAKFKQKRDGYIYARVLALGNTFIGSKFDHSDGFYRRQLLIDCKPKTRSKEDDDKFMSDKCIEEIEGILVWALSGLLRLIKNNFNFTVSKRMVSIMDGVKHEENNVFNFTEDESALSFTNNFSDYASSADLFKAYVLWCWDNGETPVKRMGFKRQFSKLSKPKIKGSGCGKGQVPGGNSVVQGYTGLMLSKNMSDRLLGLDQKTSDKIDRLP